jgi:hypothetical protein
VALQRVGLANRARAQLVEGRADAGSPGALARRACWSSAVMPSVTLRRVISHFSKT